MPETYTALTELELLTAARQTERYMAWKRAVEFAQRWYGLTAAYLTLNIEQEYDDNSYFDRVESVTATDHNGMDCLYDFTTEAWREAFAINDCSPIDFDPDDEHLHREFDKLEDDIRDTFDVDDSADIEFDLTAPPTRTYETLYRMEETLT